MDDRDLHPTVQRADSDLARRRRHSERAASRARAQRRRARIVRAGRLARGCVALGAVTLPLALAGHGSPPAAAHGRPGGNVGAPAPTGPGHVSVLALAGPPGRTIRRVWVYRPAVPDSSTLPVVYWLHGYPDSPGAVFAAGIAHSLDGYFAAGHRPFVFVADDDDEAKRGDTEWADATDGGDPEESFLLHILIPAIEGHNPRSRADRAIVGFSMGGYGAMNIALRHPGEFGQVASLAGYFHVDDPDHVFGGRPDVIAANSPDRQVAHARGLHILLDDGGADRLPVVEGESQRFARLLAGAGIPATLVLQPSAEHDYAFVRSQFPVLETFLDYGWPG
jgi:S-formylglutathione hydrolase FrmB